MTPRQFDLLHDMVAAMRDDVRQIRDDVALVMRRQETRLALEGAGEKRGGNRRADIALFMSAAGVLVAVAVAILR